MILTIPLDLTALPFEDENVPVRKPGCIYRIIQNIFFLLAFQSADSSDEFQSHTRSISELRGVIMDIPNAIDDLDSKFRSIK